MKTVLALVLAYVLSSCSPTDHRQTVVKVLSPGDGYASAVVIAPHRVVTAAHVATVPGIKINGLTVRVLGIDVEHDVAIMEAHVMCPCATIADEVPAVGDSIEIVGFPMQHIIEQMKVFYPGHYFGELVSAKKSFYSSFSMPGSSGGGIFNTDGELVGVTSGVPTWGGSMFSMPQLVWSMVAGVSHKSLTEIIKRNP